MSTRYGKLWRTIATFHSYCSAISCSLQPSSCLPIVSGVKVVIASKLFALFGHLIKYKKHQLLCNTNSQLANGITTTRLDVMKKTWMESEVQSQSPSDCKLNIRNWGEVRLKWPGWCRAGSDPTQRRCCNFCVAQCLWVSQKAEPN